MKQVMKTTLLVTGTLALSQLLTACGQEFSSEENLSSKVTSESVMSSKFDLNLHPMNKTICDPFDGTNNTQVTAQGVLGTLFYKTAATPNLSGANDYVNRGKKSDKSLFFADINVPTRLFNQGFSTQTTSVLKDDSGNKLVEYFGIKFESNLQLSEADTEGDYELALLSDDGSRLRIKDPVDDTWKEIIDNDGDHNTRMGCATRTIKMTRRTSIPIEVTYYQGPREHIANVLIWRKASEAGKDSSCNQAGNDMYFDYNNGSAPKAAYNGLLARGWSPVAPANLWLNSAASYNPCVAGTAPVITNFAVRESALMDVFLAWTTDIPSSTQVRFVNVATGVESLTTADNLLGTDHQVHIGGLQPHATYKAQAVSISADLGKTVSSEITFTLP